MSFVLPLKVSSTSASAGKPAAASAAASAAAPVITPTAITRSTNDNLLGAVDSKSPSTLKPNEILFAEQLEKFAKSQTQQKIQTKDVSESVPSPHGSQILAENNNNNTCFTCTIEYCDQVTFGKKPRICNDCSKNLCTCEICMKNIKNRCWLKCFDCQLDLPHRFNKYGKFDKLCYECNGKRFFENRSGPMGPVGQHTQSSHGPYGLFSQTSKPEERLKTSRFSLPLIQFNSKSKHVSQSKPDRSNLRQSLFSEIVKPLQLSIENKKILSDVVSSILSDAVSESTVGSVRPVEDSVRVDSVCVDNKTQVETLKLENQKLASRVYELEKYIEDFNFTTLKNSSSQAQIYNAQLEYKKMYDASLSGASEAVLEGPFDNTLLHSNDLAKSEALPLASVAVAGSVANQAEKSNAQGQGQQPSSSGSVMVPVVYYQLPGQMGQLGQMSTPFSQAGQVAQMFQPMQTLNGQQFSQIGPLGPSQSIQYYDANHQMMPVMNFQGLQGLQGLQSLQDPAQAIQPTMQILVQPTTTIPMSMGSTLTDDVFPVYTSNEDSTSVMVPVTLTH